MKPKLFTFLLTFFIMLSMNGLSQNLLAEGDFNSTTDILMCDENTPAAWCEFSMDITNANATVVDGVCNFHVNNPSAQNWDVQLIQAGFNLEAGHAYNLSFDVKADKEASFGVFLGEVEGNWTNLVGDRYWQESTTDWQTISLDFDSPFIFAAFKLSFEFGLLDNTTVFIDNVSLTDLGMYSANIGIIGDAVFGWEGGDAFMETTDGVIYTLTEFPLNRGELKFRQDGDWIVNWGPPWDQPPAFPDGIGVKDGQNIPIPKSGNYDIMFDRSSGEYHFTCISNCALDIGVTGTAVPPFFNWDENYPMISPDGENYFIPFRYFGDGEVKFRQLDNWDMIWGATDFPYGVAVPGGEGIPVAEAFYTVHFNINTLEYQFDFPFLGMVGDALEGWDNDIPMETNDGIHYTLPEHYFNQGETKIRANHNWAVNFGTYLGNPSGGFPADTAVRNQMNFIVPAGIYTVNFNLQTKEYSFEGSPCIICPQDTIVFAESDQCGAVVEFPELSVDENCGSNFTVEQVEGLPSGSLFPPGQTHQAFIAYNDEGKYMECHFNVEVLDTVPAEILNFTADYEMPWPPNHEMIPVTLNYEIIDVCGEEVFKWMNIWCNESNLKGQGNTAPDWEILDDHHVLVRAERSGKGTGREYHIILGTRDAHQNYNVQEVIVSVEHDMGKSMNKSAQVNEEQSDILTAKVWPNPTDGTFNLTIPSEYISDLEIVVFNLNGQVLSREFVRNQTHTFGEDFSPGVYFLRLQTTNQSRTIKIVKE